MQADPQEAGYLYVDGHVRVYDGKLANLPKRHVSRERLCLRGTTGYWINDAIGRPFFVVSKAVSEGMGEALITDIVPELLRSVPQQPTSRMFARWCQENCFAYMMQHYDIDGLIEYGAQELPGTTLAINPQHREFEREIKRARVTLKQHQVEPDEVANTLTVRIHRTATAAHDRAVAALLQDLNNQRFCHPETGARMIYALV